MVGGMAHSLEVSEVEAVDVDPLGVAGPRFEDFADCKSVRHTIDQLVEGFRSLGCSESEEIAGLKTGKTEVLVGWRTPLRSNPPFLQFKKSIQASIHF